MAKSFFDNYMSITGKNLPCPDDMSTDDKAQLAYYLAHTGESKVAIAKFLGCNRGYVYQLIKKAEEENLNELENRNYLEHFNHHHFDLLQTRDRLRKERDRLNSLTSNDDATAAEKNTYQRDKTELGRLIFQYDKLILEMNLKVGLIPTSSDENLYGTVKERKISDEVAADELYTMNPEQLSQTLLDRLTSRSTQLKRTGLKEVKDESIL